MVEAVDFTAERAEHAESFYYARRAKRKASRLCALSGEILLNETPDPQHQSRPT
jgi:hypothetical protein